MSVEVKAIVTCDGCGATIAVRAGQGARHYSGLTWPRYSIRKLGWTYRKIGIDRNSGERLLRYHDLCEDCSRLTRSGSEG
jgi:hypothetical protein